MSEKASELQNYYNKPVSHTFLKKRIKKNVFVTKQHNIVYFLTKFPVTFLNKKLQLLRSYNSHFCSSCDREEKTII